MKYYIYSNDNSGVCVETFVGLGTEMKSIFKSIVRHSKNHNMVKRYGLNEICPNKVYGLEITYGLIGRAFIGYSIIPPEDIAYYTYKDILGTEKKMGGIKAAPF